MRGRRSDESYKRKKKNVRPNPYFIIVCEGSVTEVDYFKSFPYYNNLGGTTSSGLRYGHEPVHIEGGAGQHVQVVRRAERVLREKDAKLGSISKADVWCVFDCDRKTPELREAVELARRKGFKAIYSVQCFELWFVLHFQYLSTAVADYDERISRKLGIQYTHSSTGMYEQLIELQSAAITNAERLWESMEREGRMRQTDQGRLYPS
ncbi:RloB family protein [Paenibacillus sp. 1P07SE]|uniref:RloB family protein n=1 Tax=Paenibacillus sp. 1P07SE TaxID=3132209 RepID=UPI0039A7827C